MVSELLKEEETLSQICSKFMIHPTQARRWREQALLNLKQSFSGQSVQRRLADKDKLTEELYTQIGKLQYQLDWLKKKMGLAE